MNLINEEISTLNYYFNKLNKMFEHDIKVKAITDKEDEIAHRNYRENNYELYRLSEYDKFIITEKLYPKAEYNRARLEINKILLKIKKN